MSRSPIHKSQQKLELALGRLEKDSSVSPANRKLIVGFTENRLAQGTSGFRIVKVIYCLRYLAKWLGKGFDEASKQDMIALVGEIERRPYAEWSKYDFKVVLKLFYRWLKGNDEENPPETKWLRPKLKNTAKKLPEELLTEAEVYRMAQSAHHPRDKALVLVLYESGCRIGEMLSLKIKNVQFDQHGAVLRVTGKTGDRRVRIIQSVSELGKWLEIHPNNETESWLWPPRSNNAYQKESPAECQSIYVMLKKLAKEAGITKKVYPHLFRHSRATFLASKLTEAQMKEYFGWTQCSDMAATYVHLSGRDVDQSLLKLYHMEDKNDETKEGAIQLKSCLRCKETNSPASKFCHRCGTPLDEATAATVGQPRQMEDDLMRQLLANPEFKEYLAEKAMATGLLKNFEGFEVK